MNTKCVSSSYPTIIVDLYITDCHAQRKHKITQPMQSQWVNSIGVNAAKLSDDQEKSLMHLWVSKMSFRTRSLYNRQDAGRIIEEIRKGNLIVDKKTMDRMMHGLEDAAKKIITQKVADGVMNSKVINKITRVLTEAVSVLSQKNELNQSTLDIWV